MENIINKIKLIKNIDFDDKKKNQLEEFFTLLKKENEVHNLTRIIEHNEVWLKHFYDSLLICDEVSLENKKICDLGTGPGIPGIILKLVIPSISLTLVESNGKKTNFLKKVINTLELKDVDVYNGRAEEYSIKYKETQDIIISRAMAPLSTLLEVGVQALKVNGLFICLKSQKLDDEIKDLNGGEKKLGLKYDKIQDVSDDQLGIRKNIIYKKISTTSSNYPRTYGQIKNWPLGK